MTIGGEFVAERFEQSPEKHFSAPAWNHRHTDFQRKLRIGEFLPILAAAAEGGSKRTGESDARERRGNIRAIVDVLVEKAAFAGRAAGFADEFDRIDFDQESGSAAILCYYGIEDIRVAEGKSDGMKLAGPFVEEITQISSRLVGRGYGEIHKRQLYRECSAEAKCGLQTAGLAEGADDDGGVLALGVDGVVEAAHVGRGELLEAISKPSVRR
jgi:hypothetical protein